MIAQPPLVAADPGELTVAIATLALGGAERIVLDWAARVAPGRAVHLIVVRDTDPEWVVAPGVRVTRIGGLDVARRLGELGAEVAAAPVPVCVCHLLTASERRALARAGAFVVPVVHNAREGWLEDAAAIRDAPHVVAVSEACAVELRRAGCRGTVTVIRHRPPPRRFPPGARAAWREAWRIPPDATVIGMVGAVKPQKDYPLAVRVVRAMLERRDVYLAIVGGPVGRHGRAAWTSALDAIRRSGVRHRVAMPGFVHDAARCLPAFDVLLNTSRYEGLSVATADAIANGVPVVASDVGGQREIEGAGAVFVPRDATEDEWADAVVRALSATVAPRQPPAAPAHRLWTLTHLARPLPSTSRVLFVTANLNAGGAQRSLVNLVTAARGRIDAEVVVAGESTAEYFWHELRAAGVAVHRAAASRDVFDQAEAIVAAVCRGGAGAVCFWNVDAKVKLAVTKALAFTGVGLVDVSPGPEAFAQLEATDVFGRQIAFAAGAFYERLDRVVLKYHGPAPSECAAKVTVIRNGVPPAPAKARYDLAAPARIVVNGRIAPAKFLIEIVDAVGRVAASRRLELHVFGSAEPRHADYAAAVRRAADASAADVYFHGAAADVRRRLAGFDACVVLGQDQGCPNAVLEALAAGLPVVANDDGGTAEQIVDGRTGLLVGACDAAVVADALRRLLDDRPLAARLGAAGRAHVQTAFSMRAMIDSYASLFDALRAHRRADDDVSCVSR